MGNGGDVLSQRVQMEAWIKVQERTVDTANFFPIHFFILELGWMATNANTTVRVLAKTLEMATEKIMPKVVCLRKQVNFTG